MLYNEPSPLETRVLSRRFRLPNSVSIETYLSTDGYKAFLKAAEMKPETTAQARTLYLILRGVSPLMPAAVTAVTALKIPRG